MDCKIIFVITPELRKTSCAEAELGDLWPGVLPHYRPTVSIVSRTKVLPQTNAVLSYKIPQAIELHWVELKNPGEHYRIFVMV